MAGRIFVTGDTHYKEEYQKVERLCEVEQTDKDDTLIILGDHGCNYYGEKRDRRMKKYLESLPISFILIKGNHDQRPIRKVCEEVHYSSETFGGDFLVDPDYPSIFYPHIFGEYTVLSKRALIMGGAYSVDKWYRLQQYELGYHNYRWFPDEQMSQKEMDACELMTHGKRYEYVFTHTCPLKYEPYDKFLTGIDQSEVDKTMEIFFDRIEDTIPYRNWFCGHYHIDRISTNQKMRLMYNDVILIGSTDEMEEELF